MKKRMRTILCVILFIFGLNLLLAGSLYYAMFCKETLCDASVSPKGAYKLLLMEIGEPEWPFGAASGQLILKEGDTSISQADFKLKNDGCGISASCWAVSWNEDYVEVILSGEEQYDEQILLYFGGAVHRQFLTDESEATTTQLEMDVLDIEVIENRENELVFSISIDEFIGHFNEIYGSDYLTPSSQWQCFPRDSGVHSEQAMDLYYFTKDEQVYSLPTITVYVPTNADYVQEITVNFDEHSYTEWGYEQYRKMCFCTCKVFLPDLSDEAILNLCTEAIALGDRNIFSSEEWYGPGIVPCALFCRDGIGIYPYFAIGDWERLCVIPIDLEIKENFEQKGVEIHEIS